MASPESIAQAGAARARDNVTLSAVVYVEGRESAEALDETFFSLALQDWRDVEVVVALAAAGADAARAVAEIIEAQPWLNAPRYRVLSGGAGRGELLNRAVGEAVGRFLVFLEAGEEVAYQHGYAALVGRLLESGRAFAAGGCRSAHLRRGPGHRFVETKDDFALGRTPRGLLSSRLAPLCAHVFDRARVEGFDLSFGASARAGAERDLFARLYAAHGPADDSLRHVFVCERRLRAGGAEGILYAAARGAYALRGALRRLGARLRGGAGRGAR
ncbi:MAG TPA: hypothetical protein VF659_13425 [Pyrinomonadaceae bacterium]|jgi:hypothetical protein